MNEVQELKSADHAAQTQGVQNGAYWVRSSALGSDQWELVQVQDGYGGPGTRQNAYVMGSDSPYFVSQLIGEWRPIVMPA